MALEARELSFEYRPGRPVLRGVSAAFEAGRVTGLVGPNGAGKSTLLRLLLGVLEPTGGAALLDGEPVAGIEHRRRARRMAYVSQRPSVAFSFTVRGFVGLGRYGAPGADGAGAVRAALEAVDLADRAEEPFGTLSAGQQQRASLARAMAQLDQAHPPAGTRALILDEPLSALDPRHVLQTTTILRELADRGMAVVLALHDLRLAARFCDAVAVLDGRGSLAAAGPAAGTLVPGVLDPVFGVRFDGALTPSLEIRR